MAPYWIKGCALEKRMRYRPKSPLRNTSTITITDENLSVNVALQVFI